MISHYEKIAQAICFINANRTSQPNLDDIANEVCLSPYHFQRLFQKWAGITPKQFLQFLTVQYAKQQLKKSTVLNVATDLGLSSSSRLYDHFITLEAVSPGEFKNSGHAMKIEYGQGISPFGPVFIAVTKRGICKLAFIEPLQYRPTIEMLQQAWPNAVCVENQSRISKLADDVFNPNIKPRKNQRLLVKGTNFQVKVWQALLQIPSGAVFSYQQIAQAIAKPSSSRATANAIAHNQIGYLIPCHRVIRNTGIVSQYRWGQERKQAILAWEAAQLQSE